MRGSLVPSSFSLAIFAIAAVVALGCEPAEPDGDAAAAALQDVAGADAAGAPDEPDAAPDTFETPAADTWAGDGPAAEDDAPPAEDAPQACVPAEVECPKDHACLPAAGGEGHVCTLAVGCDEAGLLPVSALMDSPGIYKNTYVKVDLAIGAADPICAGEVCANHVCEPKCFAGFQLDGNPNLLIKDLDNTFGCEGTESTFLDRCKPFTPGKRYRVWGWFTYHCLPTELYVKGFCELAGDDAVSDTP